MKRIKIYTAGKMGGLDYGEQMGWRNAVEGAVRGRIDNADFVHPPVFYNPNDPNAWCTEDEAMEWDLNQIRDSDVVIVNTDTIDDSIGTHYELGFINAINSFGSKHVYVIGIGLKRELHPWIERSLFKWVETVDEAADYITYYMMA